MLKHTTVVTGAAVPPVIKAFSGGSSITELKTRLGDTISFDLKATASEGFSIESVLLQNKSQLEKLGAKFTKRSAGDFSFSWKILTLSEAVKAQAIR